MARYRLPAFMEGKCDEFCFICRGRIGRSSTLEHLIPQWLIRHARLEDRTVTVGPDLYVRYMDYLVPCCRDCNCSRLSRVERQLARVFKDPKSAAAAVPVELLCIWGCKLLAGVTLYQKALGGDGTGAGIEAPDSKGTVPDDLCRGFLRMLKGGVTFRHLGMDFPFSRVVLRTKVPPEPEHQFDYKIYPILGAFLVRLGCWSVLGRFDGGYIQTHGMHVFEPYLKRRLAPVQVSELAAHFMYMSELQARDLVVCRTKGASPSFTYLSSRGGFREADLPRYRWWLSTMSNIPLDQLCDGPLTRTFLEDANGKFLSLPASATFPRISVDRESRGPRRIPSQPRRTRVRRR